MEEIWLGKDGEKFHALLFRNGSEACIVMAHGFGAVKDALLPYADVFKEKFDVLLFDYRHFGKSDGEPRQLISIKKQLEDWERAVKYAKERYRKVALWGSSFSGGHVLVTASKLDVDAVVSQVPFVDGMACVKAAGMKDSTLLTLAAFVDLLASLFGRYFNLPIVSPPGKLAFMNTPDAMKYLEMLPEGVEWENSTPARVALSLPRYKPIRFVDKIKCPVMYVIAENDLITPAYAAHKAAKMTKKAEVFSLDCGHFDVYLDYFDKCTKAEMEFLERNL
ncbi:MULTISPECIES: alpha/beta hydrolase [unclassified Archaeoglobus]|jgi:hypothetical protein|uniref:alpha/beta hydrolase n=1 Tax=unclassified Archaeoglobus TaxID=2643606 RepID=UPI0025BD402F|nr:MULTISPECIES: alpha/beta hydrolase [unclassified Archaeoglobus]